MSEWREWQLDDFMLFNPSEKLQKDTVAKKVAMEHIAPYNGKVQGFINAPFSGGTKFRNGDTIMARITPCLENGKTAYIDFLDQDEVAFGSTEFIVFREINGVSNSRFIYYLAIHDEFRDTAIQLMTGTSGRQRIEMDALKKKVFTLPPLNEQEAIAEMLSSLDDKIDLLNRQNKTLEELAQTYFRQWFVEEAREDWEVLTINDLAKVGTGKGLSRNELNDYGQYQVLGANGEIGRTDKYLIDEKVLITGRVGTHGKVFRISQKVWVSDNALIIKPKKYIFYFALYFVLKGIDYENMNIGSTQPLITQTDLKNCKLSVPNKEIFNRFDYKVGVLFSKIDSNNNQIQTLQHLRDTLLPKLISGEVRLKQ